MRSFAATCSAIFMFVLFGLRYGDGQDLIIDTDSDLPAGTYTYGDVHVTNSATLALSGAVTLECASLTVEAGARVSADKKSSEGET
jgi:hypothetical protein